MASNGVTPTTRLKDKSATAHSSGLIVVSWILLLLSALITTHAVEALAQDSTNRRPPLPNRLSPVETSRFQSATTGSDFAIDSRQPGRPGRPTVDAGRATVE